MAATVPSSDGRGRPRRGRRQRNQLWVAPVVGAAAAVAVAAVALTADHFLDWRDAPLPIFVGDADSARMLLSIIGGAVATLLALVFTVIAVVIQLAIGHYTPRALTILLGDRPTHFTIGVFVGTFTYALVVLLCLRVATDDDVVSGLSLTTAFGLAILTIGTFAVYSNHIIHSVRATSLIQRIGSETRETIDQLHPPFGAVDDERTAAPDKRPDQVLQAPKPGVLVDVDDEELLRQAASTGCTLVVLPPIGAFVPAGGPLLAIHGGRVDAALAGAVELADERDMRLDASFGLRQLMDIAARALSPGVNDPATALQVLDELHDLLRRLVQRRLRHGHRHDATGQLRVVLRLADWDEIIALTLDEMRRLASGSMAVNRRLRAVLEDLLTVAPPPRQQALEQQLALLERAVASAFATDFERHLASQADPRGTGF